MRLDFVARKGITLEVAKRHMNLPMTDPPPTDSLPRDIT